MAFKQNMSFLEAHTLKVGDKIDHRNIYGQYALATIIHKANQRSGMVRIHYDALSSQHDTECSYMNDLHRFAFPNSISQRPAHRLKNIKKGSFVDIHIKQHQGWRKAEVVACSQRSGQVQVQYLLDVSDGITQPIKRKTWLHLDNTAEVDSFGIHTLQKEVNRLALSLETKRAYSNIPNEVKESCAKDIIDSIYGGMGNILSILIENASTKKLQQIQQMIKVKNTQNIAVPQHNTDMSLSQLSADSISHICSYLEREDIKSFKLTSYHNGIVCLREMTKCNVAISNMNFIIDDCEQKYVDALGMIIHTNYNYHRYAANMDYLSLREIWSDTYNIPLSQQLLLSQNEIMCRFYDTGKNEKMNRFKIRMIPTRKWLLFDKRNLIKFDENTNKAKIMRVCNEKQQCITFLKWFDIYFQEITPLQFVMGNMENMTINRLTRYIENEFIATTSEQKRWHSKVLLYFKKMDQIDAGYPKLIAYREQKNKLLRFVNPNERIEWWNICIFQLNTSHPAFNKYKFTAIEEKYSLLL